MTKFEAPSIWKLLNMIHHVEVDLEWSEDQIAAYRAWAEDHYISGEAPEASVGRFKRTKVGKAALN
jgi:hypothetical protein